MNETKEKYLRFCPECRKQTYEWKCPRCKVKTRRVNMQRTIGDIAIKVSGQQSTIKSH